MLLSLLLSSLLVVVVVVVCADNNWHVISPPKEINPLVIPFVVYGWVSNFFEYQLMNDLKIDGDDVDDDDCDCDCDDDLLLDDDLDDDVVKERRGRQINKNRGDEESIQQP